MNICFCFIGIIFQWFQIQHKLKIDIMNSILYIIAVILVIGWIFGFFFYSAGGIIHVLLVIAVIAVLFNIISGRRPV